MNQMIQSHDESYEKANRESQWLNRWSNFMATIVSSEENNTIYLNKEDQDHERE